MNEHFNNLNSLFELDSISKVLDAGSGKTSLSYLIKKYPNSTIDAIVYPGDTRKINSIKENVQGNYNLLEKDLCKEKIEGTYDLVLAHLLLGEATKFDNKFEDLLDKLLDINSKYYLIYDYKEDPTINYEYLKNYLKEHDFIYVDCDTFAKEEPQQFDMFLGEHYVAYLLKRKDITDIVFDFINNRIKINEIVQKLKNLKLCFYSKEQQKDLKELIKTIEEKTSIEELITDNNVINDILLNNKTYLEIACKMTPKELLIMIAQYICSKTVPDIDQEMFDLMVDVGIKNNQREKLWRLAFNYEYRNKDFNKIIDYFIKEKDAYYLSETLYVVGSEVDKERLVKALLKEDKNFVKDFLTENINSGELDDEQINILNEYINNK